MTENEGGGNKRQCTDRATELCFSSPPAAGAFKDSDAATSAAGGQFSCTI
jgi:hypothetical protein